ncbi:hypothetical protein GW17_00044594 [Ensete ventricosum]|nr:hypothetical protein GW17_00044594 [Ensete ventricosum]
MGGTYRSARLLVHGPAATKQYCQNQPSTVDFGRRQLIEGEIDSRRSIEGEKRKKKKKKKKKKKRKRRRNGEEERSTSRCPCPRAVATCGSPASRRRPRPQAIFLPCEETFRLPT